MHAETVKMFWLKKVHLNSNLRQRFRAYLDIRSILLVSTIWVKISYITWHEHFWKIQFLQYLYYKGFNSGLAFLVSKYFILFLWWIKWIDGGQWKRKYRSTIVIKIIKNGSVRAKGLVDKCFNTKLNISISIDLESWDISRL